MKENNLEYILNILKMEKTGKIRKKEKNFEKVSTKKSDLELSLRELKSSRQLTFYLAFGLNGFWSEYQDAFTKEFSCYYQKA